MPDRSPPFLNIGQSSVGLGVTVGVLVGLFVGVFVGVSTAHKQSNPPKPIKTARRILLNFKTSKNLFIQSHFLTVLFVPFHFFRFNHFSAVILRKKLSFGINCSYT